MKRNGICALMEKLYGIIKKKQNTLDSLKQEKTMLQQEMASPAAIHDKAQQIVDTNRDVFVLNSATKLSKETSKGEDNSKQVLENMINHLEQLKTTSTEKRDEINLNIDIQIIKKAIKDINEPSDKDINEPSDKDNDSSNKDNDSSNKDNDSSDIDPGSDLPGFDDF